MKNGQAAVYYHSHTSLFYLVILKVFVGLVIQLPVVLHRVHDNFLIQCLLGKCLSYAHSGAWIAIQMCQPLHHPLCPFLSLRPVPACFLAPHSLSECVVFSPMVSSLCLSTLCFCASSSLSLLPPSLLCMSTAVSPKSNYLGLSMVISIFLTSALLGPIFLCKSSVCNNNKSLTSSQPNFYLSTEA